MKQANTKDHRVGESMYVEHSRKGRDTEAENRLVVAKGWGRGWEPEVTTNGHQISFWGNGMFKNRVVVMGARY